MEQKKSVLIVEDEKNIVDILRFNLQREGYETLEAYDGETGLELARERKCGLVLVTHYPKSPGAALADVVLQCGASEGPLQLGSVPARMAQLFIIDAVFHEYCRRDVAEMERNRELVAKALAEKHI